MKKLYIGNVPYQASESDLQSWFLEAGVTVDTVSLVRDRFSGELRGFGFVEINDDAEAERAIRLCFQESRLACQRRTCHQDR